MGIGARLHNQLTHMYVNNSINQPIHTSIVNVKVNHRQMQLPVE
jgi:hypothetical protein